jgi:dipeptidyl aminopeptidase/acylaminoacyl peptidase
VELARQAAPLTYVDRRDPPTLLLHGRQDCNVPFAQSETLHAALRAAGVTTELTLIDAPHANPAFYTTKALQEQVIRFLDSGLAQG